MQHLKSQVVLISTAEFALKSGPVRRILQRKLIDDLRARVRRLHLGNFETSFEEGRLVLEKVTDAVSVAKECSRVFGVAYSVPAVKVRTDLEEIAGEALGQASISFGRGETFAIRAKNPGKRGLAGKELEVRIGRLILDQLADHRVRVNLDAPDHTIWIEVRGESTFISSQRFPGPSGLALGSQGRMLGLILDEWASLAAFLCMMKRGAFVIPIFVHARGSRIEEDGKAEAVVRRLSSLMPSGSVRLLDVDFNEHSGKIGASVDPGMHALLLRRFQFRVAEAIAPREKAAAIVSGEMLGRDYANLSSLRATTPKLSVPILRPLLTREKDDVLETLRAFGPFNDDIDLEFRNVLETNASSRDVSDIESRLELSALAKTAAKSLQKRVVSAVSPGA